MYGEIEFECNHWSVFENAIDMAHIHYLHNDTFGNQARARGSHLRTLLSAIVWCGYVAAGGGGSLCCQISPRGGPACRAAVFLLYIFAWCITCWVRASSNVHVCRRGELCQARCVAAGMAQTALCRRR